jgi:peptidoglycan hydrolase CwlO-like protein
MGEERETVEGMRGPMMIVDGRLTRLVVLHPPLLGRVDWFTHRHSLFIRPALPLPYSPLLVFTRLFLSSLFPRLFIPCPIYPSLLSPTLFLSCTMSRLSSPLVVLSLFVLLFSLLPSSSFADGNSHTTHSSTPDCDSLDSFEQQYAQYQCALREAQHRLTVQQAQFHHLTTEAQHLSLSIKALERQLKALECEVKTVKCDKSCHTASDCLNKAICDLNELLEKADKLSCQIEHQLTGVWKAIEEQQGTIQHIEAVLHKISVILSKWRAAVKCGQELDCEVVKTWQCEVAALFVSLRDGFDCLHTRQCWIDETLACVEKDVGQVACWVTEGSDGWCQVEKLYHTYLQCLHDAKELSFLCWVKKQLSHYQCRVDEAKHVLCQQREQLHRLQSDLCSLAHQLACLDTRLRHLLTDLNDGKCYPGHCSTDVLRLVKDIVKDVIELIEVLEKRVVGLEKELTTITRTIREQEEGLKVVVCRINDLRAIVDKWECEEKKDQERKDKCHGEEDKKKEEKREEKQEREWAKALIKGLNGLRAWQNGLNKAERAIWSTLRQVERGIKDLSGCGLIELCDGKLGLVKAMWVA